MWKAGLSFVFCFFDAIIVGVDKKQFETVVGQVFDQLPARFRRHIHNVAIVVQDHADDEILDQAGVDDPMDLFGFYTGIPLTERTIDYGLVPPDVIYIFQKPIEAVCQNDDEVREEIRKTVLHEIAHYFGIDEDRLEGTAVE